MQWQRAALSTLCSPICLQVTWTQQQRQNTCGKGRAGPSLSQPHSSAVTRAKRRFQRSTTLCSHLLHSAAPSCSTAQQPEPARKTQPTSTSLHKEQIKQQQRELADDSSETPDALPYFHPPFTALYIPPFKLLTPTSASPRCTGLCALRTACTQVQPSRRAANTAQSRDKPCPCARCWSCVRRREMLHVCHLLPEQQD